MDYQEFAFLCFRRTANNVLIDARSDYVSAFHTAIPFDTATGNIVAAKRCHQLAASVIDSNDGIVCNVVKNNIRLEARTERIREHLDILTGIVRHVAIRCTQVVSAVTGNAVFMGEPHHTKRKDGAYP